MKALRTMLSQLPECQNMTPRWREIWHLACSSTCCLRFVSGWLAEHLLLPLKVLLRRCRFVSGNTAAYPRWYVDGVTSRATNRSRMFGWVGALGCVCVESEVDQNALGGYLHRNLGSRLTEKHESWRRNRQARAMDHLKASDIEDRLIVPEALRWCPKVFCNVIRFQAPWWTKKWHGW